MRLLLPDRTRRVQAGLVGEHVHVFVYRWGVTLRVRTGLDWRHVTLRAEAERLALGAHGRLTLRAETWRTAAGTTARIPFSKRYVALKVLA